MRVYWLVILLLVSVALVSGCGLKAEERTPVPTLVFVHKATLTPLPTFTATPAPDTTDAPGGAVPPPRRALSPATRRGPLRRPPISSKRVIV